MKIQLAEPINTYFEINNGADTALVDRCFTESATVKDEGKEYQGLAAIEAWIINAHKTFQFTSTPLSTSKQGDQDIVLAEVSGNFPGSPVQLNYAFVVNNGKIHALEIF